MGRRPGHGGLKPVSPFGQPAWGRSPWKIRFRPRPTPLPEVVDLAVVGGGFAGLAAAAWMRRLAPERTVAVLEARRLGEGGSGRTGGIALPESAAGDLPGLGDVLRAFTQILGILRIDCDLVLTGAWEIGRGDVHVDSPITWEDSGTLRVVEEVEGGTLDPGKLVSGLARAAENSGALLLEETPVQEVHFATPLPLQLPSGRLRAHQLLFATNGQAFGLTGLPRPHPPMLALALSTEPLSEKQLQVIGLDGRHPFYTVDLPYLWGRVLPNNGIIFGSGLVRPAGEDTFQQVDIGTGEAARLLQQLESRVRGLHPALRDVGIMHRWGGPILFGHSGRPFFARHPCSADAIVLEGFSGQGVTLSAVLACWAVEALLGRRDLPAWGSAAGSVSG